MEKSNLTPFIRANLEILFVGLNPATGSSRNRHYFSVNKAFWKQLFLSGLISQDIDKSKTDNRVFGGNKINYKRWNYGITDLVVEVAESNSKKIKPTFEDFERLNNVILKFKPKTIVLLHGKVLKKFISYLGYFVPKSNTGELGRLITTSGSNFFNIAFPYGNTISSEEKIEKYKELKTHLEKTLNG